MDSIENRLLEILEAQTGKKYERDDPALANLVEGLDLDSLDAMEVAMAVEDEFGIEVPDKTMAGINSFQALLDFVNSQVQSK